VLRRGRARELLRGARRGRRGGRAGCAAAAARAAAARPARRLVQRVLCAAGVTLKREQNPRMSVLGFRTDVRFYVRAW